MDQNLKEQLKHFYNQEADFRNSKSERPAWKDQLRRQFLDQLRQEGKETLLELGPGAGYDSQFFQENGLRVTAVDLSAEMVRKCREKGVDAYELDFYQLSSLGRRFDGIYTLNALLHVPREDMRRVLAEMDQVLNPGGLVFIGIYGGEEDRECRRAVGAVPGTERFFLFYSERTLRLMLEELFDVLQFETFRVGEEEYTFHSILLRKRG